MVSGHPDTEGNEARKVETQIQTESHEVPRKSLHLSFFVVDVVQHQSMETSIVSSA